MLQTAGDHHTDEQRQVAELLAAARPEPTDSTPSKDDSQPSLSQLTERVWLVIREFEKLENPKLDVE